MAGGRFSEREREIIADLYELLSSREERNIEAVKWTIKAHLLCVSYKKNQQDKFSSAPVPLPQYRRQGLKSVKGG